MNHVKEVFEEAVFGALYQVSDNHRDRDRFAEQYRPLSVAFECAELSGYTSMYRGGAPLTHIRSMVMDHMVGLNKFNQADPEVQITRRMLAIFCAKLTEDIARGFDGFDQSIYNTRALNNSEEDKQ